MPIEIKEMPARATSFKVFKYSFIATFDSKDLPFSYYFVGDGADVFYSELLTGNTKEDGTLRLYTDTTLSIHHSAFKIYISKALEKIKLNPFELVRIIISTSGIIAVGSSGGVKINYDLLSYSFPTSNVIDEVFCLSLKSDVDLIGYKILVSDKDLPTILFYHKYRSLAKKSKISLTHDSVIFLIQLLMLEYQNPRIEYAKLLADTRMMALVTQILTDTAPTEEQKISDTALLNAFINEELNLDPFDEIIPLQKEILLSEMIKTATIPPAGTFITVDTELKDVISSGEVTLNGLIYLYISESYDGALTNEELEIILGTLPFERSKITLIEDGY
jgi:hypothetical protein